MDKVHYSVYGDNIDSCYHCKKDVQPKEVVYCIMAAIADDSRDVGPALIFHAACWAEIAGNEYTFEWDFAKEMQEKFDKQQAAQQLASVKSP